MAKRRKIKPFDKVVSKLHLHILTNKTDKSILPFVKRCVPVLASEPKTSPGGWTAYPPGPVPIPQYGLHSIKLLQHPSLKTKHSSSRFDILTTEWPHGRPGIRTIRVWFYFNLKIEADEAMTSLLDMFKAVKTKIKTYRQSGIKIIRLYEEGHELHSASLIMRKEKVVDANYSILFALGSDNGEPW